MDDYIFVGSFEKRWTYHYFNFQLSADSGYTMVSYSTKHDSILEESRKFDELGEGMLFEKVIVITNFEEQVEKKYSQFILNNIKLLRH